MTMELVTGHAGAAHVSGADVGAFNAGTIGSGTYILASSLPVLSMLDANTLEVPVCEILAEGRHVRITAAENVTIESGSQTGYRNDIVYLRYNLDSGTGEETATLVVAKGTTVANQSDVVDPTTAYSSASILNGASTVDIALVRVSLAGLTPSPAWVVGTFDNVDDSINALGNRVDALETQLNGHHIYQGYFTKDVGTNATEGMIWTKAGFESTFHVQSGQFYTCAVFFANANYDAGHLGVVGSECWPSGTYAGWHARWTQSGSGNKAFQYLVVVPDSVSTV